MKRIKLDELNKKAPFQVPEGYFDQLTLDIQARVAEKKQPMWAPAPQWKWALATAGMLTLTALLWMYSTGGNEQPSAEMLLAQVDEQALIDYLDLNEFSETDLLNGIEHKEIDDLWEDTEILDEIEINTEDLEEFLLDYEDDINS